MRKIAFFFLLLGNVPSLVQSQNDAVKLDLLKAPSSPASNLLGISASDVDKPTDVSAFMLSLQTASASFTKLPSNYAVDIAPFWLSKKNNVGDITTVGLSNSSGKNVFKQTFVVSFAMKNTDSTETALAVNSVYGGLGFKFSIFRGGYDETTKDGLGEIKKYQDAKLETLIKSIDDYRNNAEVIALQTKRKDLIRNSVREAMEDTQNIEKLKQLSGEDAVEFQNSIVKSITDIVKSSQSYVEIDMELNGKLLSKLIEADMAEADKKIKEVASAFQTARVGFTWDIAGGISAQFRNKRLNDSKVYNAGIWTTLGYTSEKFGSALFLLRLLQNPDKIFAKVNGVNDIGDITTFDFGGRYIFASSQAKFNASLEGIYRSVLSSNTIKPSWRLVFNADYAIFQNQKLTFSFGRNFDGTITKDGNLIAALTFLTGFGNKK
jgi:hypothetical protein